MDKASQALGKALADRWAEGFLEELDRQLEKRKEESVELFKKIKPKPKHVLFTMDNEGHFHLVYGPFQVRIAKSSDEADKAIDELKLHLTKIQEEIRDNY